MEYLRLIGSMLRRFPDTNHRNCDVDVHRSLALEILEDRVVPATYDWLGSATDSSWNTDANWSERETQARKVPGDKDIAYVKNNNPITISQANFVGAIFVAPEFTRTITIGGQTGRLRIMNQAVAGESIFQGGEGAEFVLETGVRLSIGDDIVAPAKTATFNWKSGRISGAGSVEVGLGSTLNLFQDGSTTANGSSLNSSLVNRGTLNFAPLVDVTVGAVTITNSKTMNLAANKSLLGAANSFFVNSGELNRTSLDGQDATIQMKFSNSGTVSVNSGILRFTGNSAEQTGGTTYIANGCSLQSTPTYTLVAGELTSGGTAVLPATFQGNLTVHSTATVSPGGDNQTGTLAVVGNVSFSGTLRTTVNLTTGSADMFLVNFPQNAVLSTPGPVTTRIHLLFVHGNPPPQPANNSQFAIVRYDVLNEGMVPGIPREFRFQKGSYLIELRPNQKEVIIRYKADAVKPGVLIAPDAGAAPLVKLIDPADGSTLLSIQAYDTSFTGGVRVASADFNDDGIADIVTAPGAGSGSNGVVKIFDGVTGSLLSSLTPYADYAGGFFVAAGDINNDGTPELVISRDAGSDSEILVYDGATMSLIQTISPFDSTFQGGVRLALGDINGDGFADIIAASSQGDVSQVVVYSGADWSELSTLSITNLDQTGGINIASGDTDGDGRFEILVGLGSASGSQVRVYSLDVNNALNMTDSFGPFDSTVEGEVRLDLWDYDGDGDLDLSAFQVGGDDPLFALFDGFDFSPIELSWNSDEAPGDPGPC